MAETDNRTKQLREGLNEARTRLAELETELQALRRELAVSRSLLAEKDAAVQAVQGSYSWRITAPMRWLRRQAIALTRRPAPKPAAQAPIDVSEMVAASPKTCILAHHDPDAAVCDYVFELVSGISSSGYAILFVSTAGDIPEPERRRLEPYCAGIYVRENLGRDLGSWQFGLRRLKGLEKLEWLLLANDSVFGPFFDLTDMALHMDQPGIDFWGVTDCYQRQWHLQSYYLCLRGAVVRSEVFQSFFTTDFAGLTRRQLIDLGEIGLSQALIGAGYTGAAYCPYDALDGGRRAFSHNPMHHYWDKLIAEARCPFLKIELLRDNPLGVPDLERFREVVSAASAYDLDLIEAYLDGTGAPRKTRRRPKAP